AGEIEGAAHRRRGAFGLDRGEQLLHGARRRHAERLVELDGLLLLLAHQRQAPGELAVVRNRTLDPLAVAAAQRAGGMPRQESFDLLALGRFFAYRVHGQPLSIPAAFSSSANLLRA